MKRRKFLIATSALAGGAATGLGTSAYSSATVERDASINVVADEDALLALEANPGVGQVYQTDSGELEIDTRVGDDASEDYGLNVNAEYWFGGADVEFENVSDSAPDQVWWFMSDGNTHESIPYDLSAKVNTDAFTVTNNDVNTHDITLTFDHAIAGTLDENEDDEPSVTFEDVSPGDSVQVAFAVLTPDSLEEGDLPVTVDGQITITAERSDG